MKTSQSNVNELIGFSLAAVTALFWTTGSIGIQGLNQTIPHFELNLMRLAGMFIQYWVFRHSCA